MNYMVCIDDTDMPGTRGTGWLVEDLCRILAAENWLNHGHQPPSAVCAQGYPLYLPQLCHGV